MKTIVVINGTNGSGKDSLIECLKETFPEEKIINISAIDPVKLIMSSFSSWNGEKTEESRKFMSDLNCVLWKAGDDFNFIFNYLDSELKNVNFDIAFIHCREPENIKKIINHYSKDYDVKTLLVKSNISKVANNSSDMGVFDYKYYDFTIENNGTKNEFFSKVLELFMKEIF